MLCQNMPLNREIKFLVYTLSKFNLKNAKAKVTKTSSDNCELYVFVSCDYII